MFLWHGGKVIVLVQLNSGYTFNRFASTPRLPRHFPLHSFLFFLVRGLSFPDLRRLFCFSSSEKGKMEIRDFHSDFPCLSRKSSLFSLKSLSFYEFLQSQMEDCGNFDRSWRYQLSLSSKAIKTIIKFAVLKRSISIIIQLNLYTAPLSKTLFLCESSVIAPLTIAQISPQSNNFYSSNYNFFQVVITEKNRVKTSYLI